MELTELTMVIDTGYGHLSDVNNVLFNTVTKITIVNHIGTQIIIFLIKETHILTNKLL